MTLPNFNLIKQNHPSKYTKTQTHLPVMAQMQAAAISTCGLCVCSHVVPLCAKVTKKTPNEAPKIQGSTRAAAARGWSDCAIENARQTSVSKSFDFRLNTVITNQHHDINFINSSSHLQHETGQQRVGAAAQQGSQYGGDHPGGDQTTQGTRVEGRAAPGPQRQADQRTDERVCGRHRYLAEQTGKGVKGFQCPQMIRVAGCS